jgi:hypothetical protein
VRALAIAGVLMFGQAVAAPGGEVVRVEHRDPTTAPTRGPNNALVTIELFFAPRVNMGARLPAYRYLEKLQARHPTRIRLIYRIMRRASDGPQLLAAAFEAHAQGKFDDFMDALHTQRTNLSRDDLIGLGKKLGLDTQRLESAIKEDRYREILDANERRFDRLHGGNAPNVLFNGKPPRPGTSIGSLRWNDSLDASQNDYEREFGDAFDRALDLLDHGVDPRALGQAFDDQALRSAQPLVPSSSGSVDDLDDSLDHPLANPPLKLAGLPSFGKPDAKAPIPVVILCKPSDQGCAQTLRWLRSKQEMFADEVRLVWAPFFDVTEANASELAMLGDAALCAEEIGSSPDEINASPGWRWVTKQLEHSMKTHGVVGRRVPAEKLIDTVAAELDLDSRRLSACRARMANTTLDWVAAARRSGVTKAPVLVIGGRIYETIPDQNVTQQLIEAELAPGVLGEIAPAWRRAPAK